MTKQEVELAALQMGEALRTIVWAFRPDVNHISINSVNGQLSIYACIYDDDSNEIAENVLNATLFTDGTLRMGDDYIRDGETWRQI